MRREAVVRTPPPVRSKGAPGARQASPRVLAIGAAVVVVAVVAVVLGVVLSRGHGTNTAGNGSGDGPTIGIVKGTPTVGSSTGPDALPGAADVAKLFRGIPQNHFVLGKPTAPVQLVEFIDLQCPDCQNFETTMLPTLVYKYVRPGKLSIKMEPWSILDRGPSEHDSDRGQKSTIAAAAQNKAFNFAEVFYQNQGTEGTGWMNNSIISEIAASVDGLKPYRLAADANSSLTKQLVRAVDDAAAAGRYTGTPTLLLARGIERPRFFSTGVPSSLGALEAAIDADLRS